jgi:hypothetical protein
VPLHRRQHLLVKTPPSRTHRSPLASQRPVDAMFQHDQECPASAFNGCPQSHWGTDPARPTRRPSSPTDRSKTNASTTRQTVLPAVPSWDDHAWDGRTRSAASPAVLHCLSPPSDKSELPT